MSNNVKIVPRVSRGCGTRKPGGVYIVGTGIPVGCHRMPMEIPTCPACNQPIIWFTRGIKRIDALAVFGECAQPEPSSPCGCVPGGHCMVCTPPSGDDATSWVMWVGREYTCDSFILEARKFGVSKRIPHKPKDMAAGDVVYLCYRTAIDISTPEKPNWLPGVFYAFRVTEVQKMVTEEEAQDPKKIEAIREKGLVPVLEVDENDPRVRVGQQEITGEAGG